jgi:hypothetical protein
MEDVLRDGGLYWTISGPSKLTDKSLSGVDRTARRLVSLPRRRRPPLRVLDQPETIKQPIDQKAVRLWAGRMLARTLTRRREGRTERGAGWVGSSLASTGRRMR